MKSSISAIRRLYDRSVEHWFISAVAMTIPSWFVFIQVFGVNFGWFTEKGLSDSGKFFFVPLFLFSVLFTFMRALADKYDQSAAHKGHQVLRLLLDSVNSTTVRKVDRYNKLIAGGFPDNPASPFQEILQPKEQIYNILEQMRGAISKIFGTLQDEVGISIIYRLNGEGKWIWLSQLNVENDLTIDQLLADPHTTFCQLIDGEKDPRGILFYPDKRQARQKGMYIEGPLDKTNEGVGSVLCKEISVCPDGHKFVQAVLSITTYGKQLCSEDDLESKNKIENLVVRTFETRLRLELALLFIKDALAKQEPSK